MKGNLEKDCLFTLYIIYTNIKTNVNLFFDPEETIDLLSTHTMIKYSSTGRALIFLLPIKKEEL